MQLHWSFYGLHILLIEFCFGFGFNVLPFEPIIEPLRPLGICLISSFNEVSKPSPPSEILCMHNLTSYSIKTSFHLMYKLSEHGKSVLLYMPETVNFIYMWFYSNIHQSEILLFSVSTVCTLKLIMIIINHENVNHVSFIK